eukprot:4038369-Prymnesium_polylepis.1
MPARIGARLQAVRAHARPPRRVVSARAPCARRHARVGPARLGGPLWPRAGGGQVDEVEGDDVDDLCGT